MGKRRKVEGYSYITTKSRGGKRLKIILEEMNVEQNELQDKNEVIAVNNMLHEDFKETVKNKYFYSSNDEISDYEPDDILREISRQEFMRRKLDKRSALVQKKDIACQKCDFIAKSEPGLKTHIKKKH